ncbi:MAG TPA: HAD-IA family hydrolase [Acidimicrobiales bacterium]|nr:HAD-IA family hydrolase [Acidimicrobiales bacterium]
MLDLGRIDGCVFDVDGVLTDTASLHEQAWAATFDDLFGRLGLDRASGRPFTADDYLRFVDGKTREDGVRGVLAERAIDLPEEDEGGGDSVATVAADKDRRYVELLGRQGPHTFAGSRAMLEELRHHGVLVAVASASRHCAAVMEASGLSPLVDARVDGLVAAAMALPGKPDPALFVEAARRIGTEPARTAVFEDSLAGVEAGRRGRFGLVVGVDRSGQGDAMRRHGADVVVTDLADLLVAAPTRVAGIGWFDYTDPGPDEVGRVETLTTLANGYVGCRGAWPWADDDGVSYPGTYVAGVYNRLTSTVAGSRVETESLVKLPNWLPFTFRGGGEGTWLGELGVEVLDHRMRLNLHGGVLLRRCRVVDPAGRTTVLIERRVVSMDSAHLMGTEVSLVPVDWSGRLEVVVALDADVVQDETEEDRRMTNRHLEVVDQGTGLGGIMWVRTRTVQSEVLIGMAARCAWSAPAGADADDASVPGRPALRYSLGVVAGARYTLEKTVAVYDSKDHAISEPGAAAREAAAGAPTFDQLVEEHRRAWEGLWRRSALSVTDHDDAIENMGLHAFHLLQVASPNVVGLDVGLGARGLHGEGYRGHVFWDTLFAFPVLSYRFPDVSRALLGYRYRRLGAARRAAAAAGRRGAMYPWQSGSDGRDETPTVLFNPRSGRWVPDRSGLQRHVGLAVAYEAWQHWQISGDLDYVAGPGGELIFEVARFFADLARFDGGRFHIEGVMGPDEFHDSTPWSTEPGVADNAYTNTMASWLLWRAHELGKMLAGEGLTETLDRLGVDDAELKRFDAVSSGLDLPVHDGVISQFAGYERLEPLDLTAYAERYGDIGRLDLILEAEGDSVARYQVCKQADVLMLFYLLSAEELRAVHARMGQRLDPETIQRTIEYYGARTTHGSTLSRVVHSWVLARADRQASWRYFVEALATDVADTQHGTTREGIHLGAMAGTLDLLQRGYTGLEARGESLWLDPLLPTELKELTMDLDFRGHRLNIAIDQHRLRVEAQPRRGGPLSLMLSGEPLPLFPGKTVEVALPGA